MKLTKSELIYMIGRDLALDYNDTDEFEHAARNNKGKKWLPLIKEFCSSNYYKQFKNSCC